MKYLYILVIYGFIFLLTALQMQYTIIKGLLWSLFFFWLIRPVLTGITLDNSCGITRGCYHDCTSSGCSFLIMWFYRPEIKAIEFTMKKSFSDIYRQQWFAMGFSHDERMGDDSVIECVSDPDVRIWADARHSYNDNHYNVEISHPKIGLREMSGSMRDGIITCNFTRLVRVEDIDSIFNLDKPWYLLVTNGYMDNGSKLKHELYPNEPFISPYKVDFQKHDDVTGRKIHYLVRVHGCLMVFAWMILASASIILARYYKHQWPEGRACGRRIWYQVHKVIMLSVLICVTASFIVIWIHTKGYAKLKGANVIQKAHPTLGIIVMGLTVINPLMAFIRPKSDTATRPIFKYVHGFLGTTVYVIAILNCILGVTLPNTFVPWYTMWIIIAFAIYQLVFEIMMESYECFLIKTGRKSDYEIREMSAIRNSITKIPAPPGSLLKNILIGFHVLVLFGFGITSIVTIAL
ncbi:putative ferric-chelate reductase 1 [Mercenaria mercenaria]|uniref:putative ferric-chelate reductase 1 n=1 Tax=Mercenaria mercenaria TaxID=6596 RepID=UPI00234FB105|nr:putative ferric-chelate reductase 1 [Mercenaria mercenaria]